MARLNRFYIDQVDHPQDSAGAALTLSGDEAHHMLSVLRLGVGQEVTLFDGAGKSARAKILSHTKDKAQLEVIEFFPAIQKPSVNLTMAIAPMKRDFDDLVVRLAELGVSRVVPVSTRYGEVDFSRKEPEKFAQRMRKLSIRAAKQSGLNQLLQVAQQIPLDALEGDVIVCDTLGASDNLVPLLTETNATILIGPEGGFSEQERALFDKRGYERKKLPGGTLRAATAALTAAAISLSEAP